MLFFSDSNNSCTFAPISFRGVPNTSSDTTLRLLFDVFYNRDDSGRIFLHGEADSAPEIGRICLSDVFGNTAGTFSNRNDGNTFDNCFVVDISCGRTGIPFASPKKAKSGW